MSTVELTNKAREYRAIQAEIKELQEQADALKTVMISEMDARSADELAAGEFTIRYAVYESMRFDSSKLKADRPELYSSYSKTTTSLRFTVA